MTNQGRGFAKMSASKRKTTIKRGEEIQNKEKQPTQAKAAQK